MESAWEFQNGSKVSFEVDGRQCVRIVGAKKPLFWSAPGDIAFWGLDAETYQAIEDYLNGEGNNGKRSG